MVDRFIRALGGETQGAMVVETAFVAPVLALLGLGAVDASMMISRQSELQQAVAEAAQIAIAATPDTQIERDAIAGVIRTSTGLTGPRAAQVSVGVKYRCGTATTLVSTNSCGATSAVSTYVDIAVSDSYTPIWQSFGIGAPIAITISRQIVIS